jgi:hypothetical protein
VTAGCWRPPDTAGDAAPVAFIGHATARQQVLAPFDALAFLG